MIQQKKNDAREENTDRATLIRLANSCARVAARVSANPAPHSDLNGEDLRKIATILRRLAA